MEYKLDGRQKTELRALSVQFIENCGKTFPNFFF